jgi:hypothetical protein
MTLTPRTAIASIAAIPLFLASLHSTDASALCIVNYIPDANASVAIIGTSYRATVGSMNGARESVCAPDSVGLQPNAAIRAAVSVTPPSGPALTCAAPNTDAVSLLYGDAISIDRFDRDNIYKLTVSRVVSGVAQQVGNTIYCEAQGSGGAKANAARKAAPAAVVQPLDERTKMAAAAAAAHAARSAIPANRTATGQSQICIASAQPVTASIDWNFLGKFSKGYFISRLPTDHETPNFDGKPSSCVCYQSSKVYDDNWSVSFLKKGSILELLQKTSEKFDMGAKNARISMLVTFGTDNAIKVIPNANCSQWSTSRK